MDQKNVKKKWLVFRFKDGSELNGFNLESLSVRKASALRAVFIITALTGRFLESDIQSNSRQ